MASSVFNPRALQSFTTISLQLDVACIQETRWKGSGCKFYGAKGQRYKLFWMGGKEKQDGVGIFVAEKWVDSVVSCLLYTSDAADE